ncbi:hypothetical protein L2E82_07977 [Cichorium intybus]|uniref:Uncharacterized protein n=1 Tax=Cichorium intybus TaxID=13427 RepID=A0ACB9G5B4_CICIN|nr:hypothetical protein L2E82_07977 [Cichorium intybus]
MYPLGCYLHLHPLIDWYVFRNANSYDLDRVPEVFGTRLYRDWVRAIRNAVHDYFGVPCDYEPNAHPTYRLRGRAAVAKESRRRCLVVVGRRSERERGVYVVNSESLMRSPLTQAHPLSFAYLPYCP